MPNFTTGIMFDIAGIMARRGQNVTLIRGGSTTLPAQTVIVTNPSQALPLEIAGAASVSGQIRIVLIGYRSYPGKSDFDVERGDRFVIGSTWYRIIYIDDNIPSRREAYAESIQGAK
jgi:hypothetical protein